MGAPEAPIHRPNPYGVSPSNAYQWRTRQDILHLYRRQIRQRTQYIFFHHIVYCKPCLIHPAFTDTSVHKNVDKI
jgi:hypothetical protein